MNRRRKTDLAMVSVLACLLFMWGCGGYIPKTEAEAYAQALQEYNSLTKNFLAQYNLQTPETQTKWAEDVAPVLMKVSNGLAVWKLARNLKESTLDSQRLTSNSITQLTNVLLSLGIIQLK